MPAVQQGRKFEILSTKFETNTKKENTKKKEFFRPDGAFLCGGMDSGGFASLHRRLLYFGTSCLVEFLLILGANTGVRPYVEGESFIRRLVPSAVWAWKRAG